MRNFLTYKRVLRRIDAMVRQPQDHDIGQTLRRGPETREIQYKEGANMDHVGWVVEVESPDDVLADGVKEFVNSCGMEVRFVTPRPGSSARILRTIPPGWEDQIRSRELWS